MPVPLLIELVLVIGGRCLSPTCMTGIEPATHDFFTALPSELHTHNRYTQPRNLITLMPSTSACALTNPKTNSIKMAD